MKSLYLHVGFCKKKCNYCSFFSENYEVDLVDKWLHVLEQEVNFIRNNYDIDEFETLFVGGGTPSALSLKQINKLFIILNKFDFSQKSEKTIEVNPESLSYDNLKLFKDFGITRISMGVQSLRKKNLKYLGRIHSVADVLNAVDLIRKSGFDNLNLDYIFGIQGTSLLEHQNDLQAICRLNPEHISAYSLSIEPESKFFENNYSEISSDKSLELYKITQEVLLKNGYQQYEVSAFSKIGYQCSHNLNYWKSYDYIGIGAGAHSCFQGFCWEQPDDMQKYFLNPIDALLNKYELTMEEKLENVLIFGLRLLEGINVFDIQNRFGVNILDEFKLRIEDLKNLNLLEIKNNYLKVTNNGLYVLDEVVKKIICG